MVVISQVKAARQVFPRICLAGEAPKSFVPHAVARKELDVHSFSA
jgi:hypothetical protein